MSQEKKSDFILKRLMTLHPRVIDLVLDRVRVLLDALGRPETALPPVVHIAGTNGKGSTLAFLRAMMAADGNAVHVYTSPHLVRFHERICLAGETITEPRLQTLLERCEAANRGAAITYFEITTCAAFLAFAETPADYLLLETGLGGRLDATNVVEQPALTLISPVSHDHAAYLGESLAEIAFEKAGIMKPGVLCLSADQVPEVRAVLEKRAAETGCDLRFVAAEAFSDLSLIGAHQNQNAALASAAARALGLSEAAIAKGRASAVWPGRFQRLARSAWHKHLRPGTGLWLDGGHNAAAGAAIAAYVREHWNDRPLHVIYGMLNTKDAGAFLAPVAEAATGLQAIAIPDQENSLSAEQAAAANPKARPAPDLRTALKNTLGGGSPESGPPKSAAPESRVLICGSLYLAGWVLANA